MFRVLALITIPIILSDIFMRRLPLARHSPPPHDGKCHAITAEYLAKPGDVLLCKGYCTDSSAVSAWSVSPFTHVAVIGPDRFVYEVTPIVGERRMSITEYVQQYQGAVCWRIKKEEVQDHDWCTFDPPEFRESFLPLANATLSNYSVFEPLTNLYKDGEMYCSEYVCEAMGLPSPKHSHPANFAKGGKYHDLYEEKTYLLFI